MTTTPPTPTAPTPTGGPRAAARTALVARLSLEEKASLCSGSDFWHTQGVERDGEQLVAPVMLTDGPHGLRKQAGSTDHVGLGDSVPATCFPPAAALGSTWDPALLERVGEALGRESRAEHVAVLLGPGINIKRSPLCGRNFEYLSEDPVISGDLGAALVRGVQSTGVGTSLKHFAVNNQETDRLRISAEVDDRALREIYLAGFERVVKDASPWTVMCSYNRVNGTYASENPFLLTRVLREEWGFDGVVVSDWGAVNDRVAGLEAGLELEMPASGGLNDARIVAAVREGRLEEGVLDRAVERLLLLLERTEDAATRGGEVDLPAHHVLAREVAGRAAVLLKNDGGLLPLDPGAGQRIAVVGEFARTPRYQGAGSSQVNPTRLDTALDELRALAGEGTRVDFAPGFTIAEGPQDDRGADALREEAVAAARAADVAVLFLGLPAKAESEGYDRTHLDLPPEQVELLAAVAAVQERVVVVLANGAVVAVSPWIDRAGAVLEAWLGGQAGGGAVADLLFGRVNPSGRLAETIPVRLADTPAHLAFPGELGAVRYAEGLHVGYRWYDAREVEPAFAFGHGLSYTTFVHDEVSAEVVGRGDDVRVRVSVRVTNTGDRAGAEVVQVYVGDVAASLQRPVRELKAFAKVHLEAGASQTAHLELDARDLSFFHPVLQRWVLEAGEFEIAVGASSRDLRGRVVVEVDADPVRVPLTAGSSLGEWLADPSGRAVAVGRFAQGEDTPFLHDEEMLGFMTDARLATALAMSGAALADGELEEMLARARG